MLVAGMRSGRALGGSCARFWLDSERFGTGLGGFWEGLGVKFCIFVGPHFWISRFGC